MSQLCSICVILVASLFAMLMDSHVFAQSQIRDQLPAIWTWSKRPPGNVCGIYAVARALELLGKPIELESMWSTRYMSHGSGSTPDELRLAISDFGGKSTITSGLSGLELRSLQYPLIANVRSKVDSNVYDHWVCAQPSTESIMVFDGPTRGQRLSYPEFLATWDGIGILVTESDPLFPQIFGVRVVGVGTLLLAGGLAIVFLADPRKGAQPTVLTQVLTSGMTLVTVLIGGSLLYGTGVYGVEHSSAIDTALLPHVRADFREAKQNELLEAVGNPKCLMIDARMPADFSRGTIGNAVNVPVFAGVDEICKYLSTIPKDTPIFAFCQSAQCGFDEIIARRLCAIGFSKVFVSTIGYAEYMSTK